MKKIIYHGSKDIIEKPIFGKGKLRNDYGRGFYCTQSPELAKEWAVDIGRSGYANQYELDFDELSVLDLCQDAYGVLHWLAVLVDNRTFDAQSDFGNEAKVYLLEHFLPPYTQYDVIIGYRADDSYFSFAQDFLNNAISLRTLSKAMQFGELGQQIVLKSQKSFEQIRFVDAEVAQHQVWYPAKESRDTKARKQYADLRNEGWRRGEIYMMKILDEEMRPNDARLR